MTLLPFYVIVSSSLIHTRYRFRYAELLASPARSVFVITTDIRLGFGIPTTHVSKHKTTPRNDTHKQWTRWKSTPSETVSFTNLVPVRLCGSLPSSTQATIAARTFCCGSNGIPTADAPPPWPTTHAPGPELQ